MITQKEYKKLIGKIWTITQTNKADKVIKDLVDLKLTYGFPLEEIMEDVYALNTKLNKLKQNG